MTTALVVLAGAVEPARATDSQAPPGSGHRWLPTEDWVMRHWLPYDEAALYRELRTDRAGVRRWLRDDHRTLEQLARRRGVETAGLAQRLVIASGVQRSGPGFELRARRAHRTLTQGHLAQHVLFHVMHQPAIGVEAPRLFGVAPSRYMLRRLNGHSPVRIARVESRGQRRRLASRVVRVVRRSGDEGVRVGATSSRQAATFLGHQRRELEHWLDARIRGPRRERLLTPAPRTRRDLDCYLFQGRLCAAATPVAHEHDPAAWPVTGGRVGPRAAWPPPGLVLTGLGGLEGRRRYPVTRPWRITFSETTRGSTNWSR